MRLRKAPYTEFRIVSTSFGDFYSVACFHSLNFLTPKQYYMKNPEEFLRIRESKIERARVLRRETNMKERNGGEIAGTVS